MKKVILYKGLPGCGKSTHAKALQKEYPGRYKRVNKDDLRNLLDANHWSKKNEKFVLRLRDHIILQALEEGYHVLVDDTNLHARHERRIGDLIKGKAELLIEDFTHVPVETCIERDLARPNSVGAGIILGMYRQFLEPPKQEAIKAEQDASLPKAILCDLDGTLCLLNGRNPFDASECDNDLLNEPVAEIVKTFQKKGRQILFFSGRDDQYKEPTIRFIERHLGADFPYKLVMRKHGDRRKDSIVKREMFNTHIRGRFYIDFVLDDRNQVVDMWRELGLTCLQVAPGDF